MAQTVLAREHTDIKMLKQEENETILKVVETIMELKRLLFRLLTAMSTTKTDKA